MIRPLDIQNRLNPGDYVNRVQQTEHGHEPGARDFAYEVAAADRDGHRKHHSSSHEFGEDTYEPSAQQPEPDAVPEDRKPARDGESNLDITA
jgi:hypothetical protein